jgi:carboxymethylenebutenolidase
MSDDLIIETIHYDAPHGRVRAYLAKPTGPGPFPAIVIGMEAFGWAEHILEVTRRFGQEGYLAIMPDLYTGDPVRESVTVADIDEALPLSRLPDPEPELAKLPADRQEVLRKVLAWRKTTMSNPTYLPAFVAAVEMLKPRDNIIADKIGVIGFCMGGWIVGEALAQGLDVAAGSIWYGRLPAPERVGGIKAPFQGHFGGLDAPITDTVPAFQAAMEAAGKTSECFVYDGAPHAFANDTRSSYREGAATLAWERTRDFFAQHLKD